MHLMVGASIAQSFSEPIAYPRPTSLRQFDRRVILHAIIIALSCWVILIGQPARFQLPSTTTAHTSSNDDLALRVPVGFAPQVVQAPLERGYRAENPTGQLLAPAASRPQVVAGFFRAEHRLIPGETLGSIAGRYDISLESLIWMNGLERGDALMPGQILQIPHTSGLLHTIQPDERIADLAEYYQVNLGAILGFGPNQIAAMDVVEPGRVLFIPQGHKPLPEAIVQAFGGYAGLAARTVEPAGIVLQNQTNIREGPGIEYGKRDQLDAGRQVVVLARHESWLKVQLAGIEGWVREDLVAVRPEIIAATAETQDFPPPPPRWVWPARGTITSRFGPRWGSFHNGLDIANRAWSPIVAARSGVVREAGWCRGYGYCVKINHSGGVLTVYGHLIDQPVVRVGEEVTAGELIGHMGSTYDRAGGGYSTGVHLHFSVFINGAAVDPLRVLP